MPELPMDQAHDNLGAELYRLRSLYTPPPWVKAASEEALKGDGDMPAGCYADPAGRRYPVHTRAATWLSTAYFLDKVASLDAAYRDRVGESLSRMADYWAISGPVASLTEEVIKASGERQAALADDDFALVERVGDGPVGRCYPLRNAEEVKAAAAWLVRYRDEFPLVDRRTIAGKIMAKAAAWGADVGPVAGELSLLAGGGGCDLSLAVDALDRRGTLLARREPATAATLRKLAAMLRAGELDAADAGVATAVATALDDADRGHGLASLYGEGGLDRPEDVMAAVAEKRAADDAAGRVTLASGSEYARDQLAGVVDLGTVRGHMGDAFADLVASPLGRVDAVKLAAAAAEARGDDAAAFDRMMIEAGRPPLARAARPAGGRPSLAQLAELVAG